MGQETSRQAARGAAAVDGEDDISLWEGVPKEILWLVQSQVRMLLTNHASALQQRPEQLQAADEHDKEVRGGQLQLHEARLAASALRDRSLSPRLQKVLDRLVPSNLTEVQFWDNFFSHVDVIKVRLVTDFLCAQDNHTADQKRKQTEWVCL